MKKLTVNEQEELFAQDCKLINLRYEYRIDRIVHPDYNYTQANQKFKYWLKRQVLSLEKAND